MQVILINGPDFAFSCMDYEQHFVLIVSRIMRLYRHS